MSVNKTVYLVSGANRGIGLGLVTSLVSRPNTIVYAGSRDPSAAALLQLESKFPNFHVVKLTSGSEEDNNAAVQEIKQREGQLDVVIANAGISKFYGPLTTSPLQEFTDHFNVNVLGVVALFQATTPLLFESPSGVPKFVAISTGAASNGQYVNINASAYASSKAAVNFLMSAAHVENEAAGLVAFALNPGWVQTDMGNAGAAANGMKEAPVTLSQSVEGILGVVDRSSRDKSGGHFLDFEKGDDIPF